MKCCQIIIGQFHLLNFTKFQLLKDLFNPHKFASGQSHRSICSFCIEPGNNTLFLSLPRNDIPSGKYTISCGGCYVNGTTNLRFEYFLCSHTTIPVLDPFWQIWECKSQFMIINVSILHELTNNSNYIRNIRSCNNEVNEFSHQCTRSLWI